MVIPLVVGCISRVLTSTSSMSLLSTLVSALTRVVCRLRTST